MLATASPAGCLAEAEHPDRALPVDNGQMMDRRARSSSSPPSRSRSKPDTETGSAVIHSRTRASARMDASGERAQQVARGEDPDQPAVSRRPPPSRCRGRASSAATSPSVSSGETTSGSADMTSPTVSPSPFACLEPRRRRADRALEPRARPRSAIVPGAAEGSGGLSTPAKLARKGARWRPTIFAGGHQSGSGLAASA